MTLTDETTDHVGRAADEVLAFVAARNPGVHVTPKLRQSVVDIQLAIVGVLELGVRPDGQ